MHALWFWIFVFAVIIAIILYRAGFFTKLNSHSSDNDSHSSDTTQPTTSAPTASAPTAQVWNTNIEKATRDNESWRKILTTTDNLQVVAMSIPPRQDLWWEVHPTNDQFFRVESGVGQLKTSPTCEEVVEDMNGNAVKTLRPTGPVHTVELSDGISAIVPHGVCHNVVNTGTDRLKLYTIYGPPHHPPGTEDKTHLDEVVREAAFHK